MTNYSVTPDYSHSALVLLPFPSPPVFGLRVIWAHKLLVMTSENPTQYRIELARCKGSQLWLVLKAAKQQRSVSLVQTIILVVHVVNKITKYIKTFTIKIFFNSVTTATTCN